MAEAKHIENPYIFRNGNWGHAEEAVIFGDSAFVRIGRKRTISLPVDAVYTSEQAVASFRKRYHSGWVVSDGPYRSCCASVVPVELVAERRDFGSHRSSLFWFSRVGTKPREGASRSWHSWRNDMFPALKTIAGECGYKFFQTETAAYRHAVRLSRRMLREFEAEQLKPKRANLKQLEKRAKRLGVSL